MANQSILAAFERMWLWVTNNLKTKANISDVENCRDYVDSQIRVLDDVYAPITHINDAFGASSDYVIDSQIIKAINGLESNDQTRLLISTKSVDDGETSLPYGAWVMDVTRHLKSADIHGFMGDRMAFRQYTLPLIKNPSFDEVEIPAWHTNATEHTYLTLGDTAIAPWMAFEYAMLINHSGVHVHSDYVKAEVGREYKASTWVCGDTAGDVCQVVLRFFDKNFNMIQSSHTNIRITFKNEWCGGEVSAVAPSGAEYCYILLASTAASRGNFYFVSGLLSDESGVLNSNIDFTDVSIPGWIFLPNIDAHKDIIISLTDERSSETSGRYSLKVIDNSNTQNLVAKCEKISVSTGNTYGASCDVYGSGTAQLYLRFYDSADVAIATVSHTMVVSDGEWYRLCKTSTAPEGAASCEIWLVSSGGSVGTLYFDNVSFVKNPDDDWINAEVGHEYYLSDWVIADINKVVEPKPAILSGTTEPDNSLGKDGDIYVMYDE